MEFISSGPMMRCIELSNNNYFDKDPKIEINKACFKDMKQALLILKEYQTYDWRSLLIINKMYLRISLLKRVYS